VDSNRRAILCAILASATVLAAGCAASAQPTASASAAVVELVVATDVGANLRFVPDEVTAPARTRVRVTFRNASTQPHNLTFEAPISGGTRTIVEAGGSDAIDLVTPGPGRYSFGCTIHMGMSGTLAVE
jgi:plastocyanin